MISYTDYSFFMFNGHMRVFVDHEYQFERKYQWMRDNKLRCCYRLHVPPICAFAGSRCVEADGSLFVVRSQRIDRDGQ